MYIVHRMINFIWAKKIIFHSTASVSNFLSVCLLFQPSAQLDGYLLKTPLAVWPLIHVSVPSSTPVEICYGYIPEGYIHNPLPRRGQQGITASAAEVLNAPRLVQDTDNWTKKKINHSHSLFCLSFPPLSTALPPLCTFPCSPPTLLSSFPSLPSFFPVLSSHSSPLFPNLLPSSLPHHLLDMVCCN